MNKNIEYDNCQENINFMGTDAKCSVYNNSILQKTYCILENYEIDRLIEYIDNLIDQNNELKRDNEMIMDEYNRIGGRDVSTALNYLKTENEKCKEKLEMVGLTSANVSVITNDNTLIDQYNIEVLRYIQEDLKSIDGFGESLIYQIVLNLKDLAEGLKRPIDKRLLLNTIISTITLDEDVDINILADLRKLNYASFPKTVQYIEYKFKDTKKLLIEG